MANRTISQVLKVHEEFVKSIEAQLDASGKPKPVSRTFFLKQKEKRLGAMQARLASAEREKQAMIERIDRKISGLQKQITAFEKEVEVDRKNLERSPTRPDPDVGPGRRRVPVRDIRGVGEVGEARLREHGITEARQVAKMKQAQLAEILRISEPRAAEIIKAAKRL